MPFVFSPEVYDAERGLYRFRCYLTARVERWTFWIADASLRSLPPSLATSGDSLFACYRETIHAAALLRMEFGDPDAEHVLSVQDLQEVIGVPDVGSRSEGVKKGEAFTARPAPRRNASFGPLTPPDCRQERPLAILAPSQSLRTANGKNVGAIG